MIRKERKQYDWTFYGFETPAGNRLIRDWIVGLPDEARYELIDILVLMKTRPHDEWPAEHFKPLEDALSEIRFRGADCNWRIYGYFGPDGYKQPYTFLVGTEKKVSNQRDAKQLAKDRRSQIQHGAAKVHAFSFED
jgi:hypothetical protein